MYQTTTRSLVLEYMKDHKQHVSASDLLEYLKGIRPTINKTTVYRLLKNLLKEGLIDEIVLSDRVSYFELTSHPHHHHFICDRCNSIQSVNFPPSFCSELKNVAATNGCRIERHSFEFYGVCEICLGTK